MLHEATLADYKSADTASELQIPKSSRYNIRITNSEEQSTTRCKFLRAYTACTSFKEHSFAILKIISYFNLMGFAYHIKDQGAVYFITLTVHQWADVFTRPQYVELYLDSLRHCQKHKGLLVYAWVVMSNHVHLIVRAENDNLSDIIRDHKKFTAKAIYAAILANPAESRKEWLRLVLSYNGAIWFWEEGYHGEEIFSESFYKIKLQYVHRNPVKAGLVERPEHYLNSSAADHLGLYKGKIQIFGL